MRSTGEVDWLEMCRVQNIHVCTEVYHVSSLKISIYGAAVIYSELFLLPVDDFCLCYECVFSMIGAFPDLSLCNSVTLIACFIL